MRRILNTRNGIFILLFFGMSCSRMMQSFKTTENSAAADIGAGETNNPGSGVTTTGGDTAVGGTSTGGGTTVGGTSTGGTSTGAATVGDTSTGGATAGGTVTGGTSTGDTTVGDTSTGGTTVGGTSAGGTSTGGTTDGGTSAGGTSAGGSTDGLTVDSHTSAQINSSDLCKLPASQSETAYASGSGTAADPYSICNAKQFLLINNTNGSADAAIYFNLQSDIVFPGSMSATTANMTPVNVSNVVFNGNNYTISGFVAINNYSGDYYWNAPGQALFSNVTHSLIANLKIENYHVDGGSAYYGGGLVANAGNSRFYNIHAKNGYVTGYGAWFYGGIAGNFYHSEMINSSAVQVKVQVGKISSFEDFDAQSDATADQKRQALADAQANGQQVDDSQFDSEDKIDAWLDDQHRRMPYPQGPYGAGILVGGSGNGSERSFMKDCYAMGEVSGYAYFMGAAIGGYGGGGSSHHLENVFSASKVLSSWDNRAYRDQDGACSESAPQNCHEVGGVYSMFNGALDTVSPTSVLFNSDMLVGKAAGPTYGPRIDVAKTTANLLSAATFAGWDNGRNVWNIQEGAYPTLKGESVILPMPTDPLPL